MNEPPEVKATGDPRLDALVARIAAKAAEGEARKAAEAEIEPQSGPESAPSDSPRSKGRVESAENVPEALRCGARSGPIRSSPVVIERVEEPPEREAGRLAFGGIVEGRKSLPAQLPLLPRPEGPRVRLLELSDYRGVPTMARGRGAPLDLRLAVAACLLTPHTARAGTRSARGDRPGAPGLPLPEWLGAAARLAADTRGAFQSPGLCDPRPLRPRWAPARQLAPLRPSLRAGGGRRDRRACRHRRGVPPWLVGARPRDRPARGVGAGVVSGRSSGRTSRLTAWRGSPVSPADLTRAIPTSTSGVPTRPTTPC